MWGRTLNAKKGYGGRFMMQKPRHSVEYRSAVLTDPGGRRKPGAVYALLVKTAWDRVSGQVDSYVLNYLKNLWPKCGGTH
jgi:hypothetical protein